MLALEISNLNKLYKGRVQALNNVSLNIKQGEFFALLGPNGAGKSTTIGIICSLVNKDSGLVKIFGCDIDQDRAAAKSHIGLAPQEFNFNTFETPIEILVNQAGYYGIPRSEALQRAEKYLKLLDIWGKNGTQSRFLSGGMKRRLMIARAMMHEPKVLILDEPTAGVDIEVRHQIWGFLQKLNQEQKTTIILTTHYLEEAEYLCKTIAIINNGVIIQQGLMRDILALCTQHSYIAELKEGLAKPPVIKGFDIKMEDANRLVINFEADKSVSELVKSLAEKNITLVNLYLQSNRLESLFLKLTGKTS